MINIETYFSEIKKRLTIIIITCMLLVVTCYIYKEVIIYIIIKPITITQSTNSIYFIYTNITEIFFTYIELFIFIITNLIFFFSYYQIINFLSPGLYVYEIKMIKTFFLVLFIIWIIFINAWYKIFAPLSWDFFLSFQYFKNNVQTFVLYYFELKFNEYIKFFINLYSLPIIIAHVLTFLILFLNFLKKETFKFIKKKRKSFFFFFLLTATIISTPEVISQIVLSFFFFFFF